MTQVLEYLARQQAQAIAPAPAQSITRTLELTLSAPVVTPDVPWLRGTVMRFRSWPHRKVGQVQELTFGTGPSSEITSDTGFSPFPNSIPALMEWASKFLQVPWKAVPEQCQSVFNIQPPVPHPQPFPVFPDFLEEVWPTWVHPASVPSMLKRAAPLTSLEGAGTLGLAEFPPVDSTIQQGST
ncbi:UNVERIFIED_CONTAM: hypothetical protein FKN15_058566 [Acipenser sinensis]